EAGGELSGVVVDDSGGVVPDAVVTIGRQGRGGARTVVVDERGEFRSSGHRAATYDLTAKAPGCFDSERATVVLSDSDPVGRVRLELKRGVVFETRVVDESGQPIGAASVMVRQAEDSRESRSVADARGRLQLTLPRGTTFTLRVHASNFKDYSAEFGGIEELPRELVLSRGAALVVVIEEWASSRIDRMNVTLRGAGGNRGMHGAPGSEPLEIGGLAAGTYDLTISSGSFPSVRTPVELVDGETVEVRFPAEEASPAIAVEVRSPTGEAVAGAELGRIVRDRHSSSFSKAGVSDAEGRAEIEGLAAPGVDLFVYASGFAPITVEEVHEKIVGSKVVVSLAPGATALARLLDAKGDPIVGAQVECRAHTSTSYDPFWNRQLRTDEHGECRVEDLSTGRHTVTFRLASDEWQPLGQEEFDVTAGEVVVVEHRREPEARLRGTVLRNGRPVDGGWVSLFRPKAKGQVPRIPVTSEGAFDSSVAMGEDYRVTYDSKDNIISVALGERSVSKDEVWTLEYTGYDVTVSERYPEGVTPGRHSVELRPEDGATHRARAFLDAGTTAVLRGVPAGVYELTGQSYEGLAALPIAVTIEVRADLEIDLEYESTVEISPTGAAVGDRARVSRIEESGALAPLPILAMNPLRFGWPRSKAGHGVLISDEYAPFFFSVDGTGSVTPSAFVQREGGRVDISGFMPNDPIQFRMSPIGEGQGPPEFWAGYRFHRWSPHHFLPGDYRITLLREDQVIEERQIEVRDGETTKIE
ncbi:MAG: carboxypeptidase regulatory-like domain-containing protein, partial [Planctomycetes bacterium]|nr:carboxypeptidase regulatory-like domain-containing protein [Planctomycetota bacterium]